MKYEFGVTIGATLTEQDIRNTQDFRHVCVLDLRRCVNNGPFPIEETILRRLANFRVAYEQMPLSLYSKNTIRENNLYRTITEQGGNVLILTDEPVPMARFCQQLNIPFTSKELFIVETADDYMPVQVSARKSRSSQFGSLAS